MYYEKKQTRRRSLQALNKAKVQDKKTKKMRLDRWKMKQQETSDIFAIIEYLGKLMNSKLNLKELINQIPDNRNIQKCEYTMFEVVAAFILMQFLHLKSRNRYNQFRQRITFQVEVFKFIGIKLPHGDTIKEVLEKIDSKYIEEIMIIVTKDLIEKKSISNSRFLGTYRIIIDGSGIGQTNDQSSWRVKKVSKNGIETYHRSFILAILIGPAGLRIPLLWEPIEQQDGVTKEDCETNAAKRLIDRLKIYFPRLPITIIADALYVSGPFIAILKKYNWKFIITFKKGSAKNLWNDFMDQYVDDFVLENSTVINDNIKVSNGLHFGNTIYRKIYWNNELNFAKDRLSIISCDESNYLLDNCSDSNQDNCEKVQYVHLTNIEINLENFLAIENAGRERFIIEEGFNHSKNRGSQIKHKLTRTSMKLRKIYLSITFLAELLELIIIKSSWFISNYLIGITSIQDIWEELKWSLRLVKSSLNQEDYKKLIIPHQFEFQN